MSIGINNNKKILDLKKTKEYLTFLISNRKKEEENINEIIKYIFNLGVGNSYVELFDVSNNFINFVDRVNLKKSSYKKTKLSKDDLFLYGGKVLDSIDPSLKEELNNFKLDGTVIFKNKIERLLLNKQTSSFKVHRSDDNKRKLTYKININEDLNFETVKTLIHEFMHYITDKNLTEIEDINKSKYEKNIIQTKYGEFISIYFENYAKEFLENNYQIPKEEFDNDFRFKNIEAQKQNKILFLQFKIHYTYGEYNYKTFKEFVLENDVNIDSSYKSYISNKKYFLKAYKGLMFNYSEEKKKKDLHPNLIDHFDENIKDKLIKSLYSNNYVLGTLLAFDAKDKVTPKDMLHFSQIIGNDNKIEIFKDPIFKKIDDMYSDISENGFDYNILLDYLKDNGCIEKGVTL